ncbi:MAG: hypothetical protein AB7G28_07860 [Pirellulales bacterium]
MARKLQIAVTTLLAFTSLAFVMGGLWRWILIFWHMPVLAIEVDAAGQPIVHPANFDTFPYFSVALVIGLCAIISAMVPDPEHFSIADMLFATALVAIALTAGVWLAT